MSILPSTAVRPAASLLLSGCAASTTALQEKTGIDSSISAVVQ
ncbi:MULTISPECIES: hypothetical protein [unclassified Leucobacter]|nr:MULTISPECIES: hypothetical protein [unclassified Leucobacter]